MSLELNVYLRSISMPQPSVWNDAIRAAGFPVDIDTDFDVDTFTGFLPCKFANQASGFEYYASRIDPPEATNLGAPAGADFSVAFVTQSELREFAASVAAASVLAQIGGGVLFDPQSGESYIGTSAVEWAKMQLAELRSLLK